MPSKSASAATSCESSLLRDTSIPAPCADQNDSSGANTGSSAARSAEKSVRDLDSCDRMRAGSDMSARRGLGSFLREPAVCVHSQRRCDGLNAVARTGQDAKAHHAPPPTPSPMSRRENLSIVKRPVCKDYLCEASLLLGPSRRSIGKAEAIRLDEV